MTDPSDDRGQTTQDFAVGISIFLLTVTFVFAFVPGLGSPLQRGVDAQLQAGADRIGANLTSTLSVPGQPNTLNVSETKDFFEDTSSSALRKRFGLPQYVSVNVTIRPLDGATIVKYDSDGDGSAETKFALGPEYDGENAATARRVVEMRARGCSDGCILVVKLW